MSDLFNRIKSAAKQLGNAMANPDFDPDEPFARRPDEAPAASPPAPPPADEPGETVALTPPGASARPPSSGRIPGLDFSDLPPLPDVYVPGQKGGDVGETVALGGAGEPAQAPAEEGRTIAYLQPRVGADPVVGWLVVTDGPDRGRDFRLHAGRNFVGRAPEMHVALTNDPYVSRERHAVVVYDPRGNRFRVAPGEATGLVYRNGETVDAPQELAAGDMVEMGQTKLRFVPLCTEDFRWDSEAPR
jgi:hypothetical protein